MNLTLDMLDGRYHVHVETSGESLPPSFRPYLDLLDGDTDAVIANGMTYRKDDKGFIWESQFTIIDDSHVEMVTVVDPSHAAADIFLIDDKGNPTKGMITYKALLKAGDNNGVLVLEGRISHGATSADVRLTKTADTSG